MPRSKPVDLGLKYFDTRNSAIECFRSMLHNYRKWQRIEGRDAELLGKQIESHPERDEKVDVGIEFVFRKALLDDHSDSSQRCFWVQRTDGSKTDFGFYNCIKGEPLPMKAQVMGTMRGDVQKEITTAKRRLFNELKNEEGKIQCPVTGEWISYWETHADHQAPMISEIIAKAFIESYRLTWENFSLSEGRDNQSLETFTDPDLILRFQDFHRRKSAGHIVLKHKKHNLSEGGRYRLQTNRRAQQATLQLDGMYEQDFVGPECLGILACSI